VAEFRADPSRWDELGKLLALGGKFDETGRFVAPYTFWVDVDDPYTTAVVIGSNVNVRDEPSTTSAVLAQLTHETVLLAENAFDIEGWLRVELPDLRLGYISEDFVRLILDYRASWTLVEGEWLMDFFLAGD
jgi:hypothetical protein